MTLETDKISKKSPKSKINVMDLNYENINPKNRFLNPQFHKKKKTRKKRKKEKKKKKKHHLPKNQKKKKKKKKKKKPRMDISKTRKKKAENADKN
jgi:hypothetical protein